MRQEARRKDVDHCVGVLQQRFRILSLPWKLWSQEALRYVIICCIILRNIIVEDEWFEPDLNNNYLFEDSFKPSQIVRENAVNFSMNDIADQIIQAHLRDD